jgi:hypothetical protein
MVGGEENMGRRRYLNIKKKLMREFGRGWLELANALQSFLKNPFNI